MNFNLFKKSVLPYLVIIRPVNVVITFVSIILAGLICGGSLQQTEIYLAAISASLTAAAGNVINDVFDIKIDRINRPDRPLASGKITKTPVLNYYLLINLAALSFAAMINAGALVVVLCSITLIFFYSYHFKKVILIGNIVVSCLTGLTFIFGGIATGNTKAAVIPAVFAFLANLVREIVKDMQDVKGDNKYGVVTLSRKYGKKRAVFVARLVSLFIILFTIVPFIFRIYNIWFFILVMITANPLYVWFIKNISFAETADDYGKLSKLLKINMILGLAALYAGIL